MTDKPDYTKANPQFAITHEDGTVGTPVDVTIFNQDGSPFILDTPSNEEVEIAVDQIINLFPSMEARTLLIVLANAMHNIRGSLMLALQATHQLAHIEGKHDEYDEHTLCEGCNSYFNNIRSPEDHSIDATNVAEHVLEKFFVGSAKPN